MVSPEELQQDLMNWVGPGACNLDETRSSSWVEGTSEGKWVTVVELVLTNGDSRTVETDHFDTQEEAMAYQYSLRGGEVN